jgi:hypothetical protein
MLLLHGHLFPRCDHKRKEKKRKGYAQNGAWVKEMKRSTAKAVP